MERYDPSQAPNAAQWLGTDEQERALLVVQYHRRARIRLPNVRLHAVVHVIVENQLASKDEPVVRALDRLMKQGLSRHDAIHAIGSVVSEQIYELLNQKDNAGTSPARYYAAVERLTAKGWLDGRDG